MFRRVPCDLGSDIGRDKGGVDPRVAFEDRTQVAKLPSGIALDVEHVDLFIHDPDTSRDTVVDDRDFVFKGLDDHVDLCGAFLMNINAKVDLFELQSAIKANNARGDASIIEKHRQPRGPLLVTL